jgi:hypothetical protein
MMIIISEEPWFSFTFVMAYLMAWGDELCRSSVIVKPDEDGRRKNIKRSLFLCGRMQMRKFTVTPYIVTVLIP